MVDIFEEIEMDSLSGTESDEKTPLAAASGEVTVNSRVVPAADRPGWIQSNGFLLILTMVSALGGFLFGYDTGVVSGAIIEIKHAFSLDSMWIELFVSITIGGAALAAFVAGFLCDWIGRRPTLILASLIFTAGAILLGASYYFAMLVIGRLVVGVGIGMAAMAVPMYIAESAPARARGKLVVVNVLFITGGQFVATIVDGAFSYLSYDIGWRFMLGLAAIPSVLMFLGLLFMPETPRWLIYHNKKEKALQVLRKIRPPNEVKPEYQSILKSYVEYSQEKMGYTDLAVKFCTTRSVLLALFVGCSLQLFQQFAGINTVMYYSASIIQMAGFPSQRAIWLATVPGASNFVFTIVGLLLVDRLGRRKLLMGSALGTVFSFVFLSMTFVLMAEHSPPARPYDTVNGTCSYRLCGSCIGNSECGFCADFETANGSSVVYNSTGTCESIYQQRNGTMDSKYRPPGKECALFGENVTLEVQPSREGLRREWYPDSCPDNRFAVMAVVALFLYIAFFAPGMGPLPWTINSEIYPTWARSTAISIATMTNWLANLVVSMTFLTMADDLGQPITFGVYAGLCLFGLIFIALFVPETKGRRLEEIGGLFQRPYFMTWCR